MTKKNVLSLALLLSCSYAAQSQVSTGGLPVSMRQTLQEQYVPTQQYALPDWERIVAKREKEEKAGKPGPYLVGAAAAADIRFPQSGVTTTLDNGHKVWRAQVKISDAPAIGLYYDEFQLPQGVKYYLSNANGRQVLGAYTDANNSTDGLFANEAVQGEVVNLELDIAPGADLGKIRLHVDKAMVYFRAYEHLNLYRGNTRDPDPYNLEGNSSTCMINARCPLGVNYPMQRKASLQVLMRTEGGELLGSCSGTMVNNTGNTTASCKQYVLTATHCEQDNSTTNSTFSQCLFRFNFEKAACTGGAAATVNTMTGANFVARSAFPFNDINVYADFLLLELKSAVNPAWDVYLSGWNRAATMPGTLAYPKRYIGFHHPQGDVKKVSTADAIDTHAEYPTGWLVETDSSGGAPGSSGSGLFDGEGRLIGDLSLGEEGNENCNVNGKGGEAVFGRTMIYSKLSNAWEYTADGTEAFRKLKPWLDPANTGVVTLNAVKSNCTAGPTGITAAEQDNFDQAISLYPNPVTGTTVRAKVNFANTTDLSVEIYNVAGARLSGWQLNRVQSGEYSFNLDGYANGVYLLKFSDGAATVTRKVMLSR